MGHILLRTYLLLLRIFTFLLLNLFYLFALLLSPIIIPIAKRILVSMDIQVNGSRPWDLQIVDRRVYARTIAFGDVGLGESYIDGWWTCDDISGCVYRIAKVNWVCTLLHWVPAQILCNMKWTWFNVYTREMSLIPCNLQYNQSTDYFTTITETLLHSMAYFSSGAKSEKQAQFENMRQICTKLGLKPGMKVLDVGCGFGTLCKYMADNYGVEAIGVTNASGMGQEARKLCQGSNVQINVCDWRDAQGEFDRIVCIEMSDHVGPHNYQRFYGKLDQMLRPGGRYLVQVYSTYRVPCSMEIMSKYLWGGFYFPKLEFIVAHSEKYLDLVDLHDMTYDGIQTALSSADRIRTNQDTLVNQIGKGSAKTLFLALEGVIGCLKARRIRLYQLIFVKKSEQGMLHFPRLQEGSAPVEEPKG